MWVCALLITDFTELKIIQIKIKLNLCIGPIHSTMPGISPRGLTLASVTAVFPLL